MTSLLFIFNFNLEISALLLQRISSLVQISNLIIVGGLNLLKLGSALLALLTRLLLSLRLLLLKVLLPGFKHPNLLLELLVVPLGLLVCFFKLIVLGLVLLLDLDEFLLLIRLDNDLLLVEFNLLAELLLLMLDLVVDCALHRACRFSFLNQLLVHQLGLLVDLFH
jgi:hypothetical protein